MSATPHVPRPLLGGVQARIRAVLAIVAAVVAVIGLAAPAASAGTALGAQNGVAAINPQTAPAVEPGAAVSPAVVGVPSPLFDDGAVVSLVTPSGTPQVLASQRMGNAAADSIAARFPGSSREVTLQAASGPRRLDVLTESGLAIESKVGRTSLRSATRQQIARDVELLAGHSRVTGLRWEFFVSPVTGKGGPTGPLARALDEAGIPYVVHP